MRNRLILAGALILFVVSEGWSTLPAPNWEENPKGEAGALKAQIQTGGSYDAHSGNATRIVNDLHVPDALGEYGLDFTRYWNSTHNDYDDDDADWSRDFGMSGWSHSWHWTARMSTSEPVPIPGSDHESQDYRITVTITFPDGHTAKFKVDRVHVGHWLVPATPNTDPFTPSEINNALPNGGIGVRDHLIHMEPHGDEFWLARADGGWVHFVFVSGAGGYQAKEIYDQHGFRTQLIYNESTGLLERVQQEGGRALNIRWSTYAGGHVAISRVDTGEGEGAQHVTYGYTNTGYFVLAAVNYENESVQGVTPTATYTYGTCWGVGTEPCTGTENSFFSPLLKRADDPHFSGPMTKISYAYWGVGCAPWPDNQEFNLEYVPAQPYAVAEEKSEKGTMVSRFSIDCHGGHRWETNGLGGMRKFYYGGAANTPICRGYNLGKLTEFVAGQSQYTFPNPSGQDCAPNVPCQRQNFSGNADPAEVWDGHGNKTQQLYNVADDTGKPDTINYADGGTCTYDRVNVLGETQLEPERMLNPYNHWLYKKIEFGKETRYFRDARRRVYRIEYPDGSVESYTYNTFNQIETHTLPSNSPQTPAIEYFHYNALQQLEWEYNTVDGWDERKVYGYDSWGRVVTMKDGRAIHDGADYTVFMEYNGRHQVTRVHYRPTPGSSDPSVQYEYDKYGNSTAFIDELGHRKEYTFDSYRRCVKMVEWLNAPNWDGTGTVETRTWDWIYDRVLDGGTVKSPSTHTSSEWRAQVEPAFNAECQRRVTSRTFDVNNRITSEQTGLIQSCNQVLGTWTSGPDTESHSFKYDANGQKSTSTDPLGRDTTYTYDNRNRLEYVIEPKPTPTESAPITRTEYYPSGDKKKVTFPDGESQEWFDYDAFGQPAQFKDERHNPTDFTYKWGPMKKLDTVRTYRERDIGGTETQLTRFEPDGLGRPHVTTFPDGTTEQTDYDYGQISAFKNRRNHWKRLHYDARGREDYHTWDGDAAPRIDRVWDPANRLLSIANLFSVINYGYDDAGQMNSEQNNVTGANGSAQLNYLRYPSGEISYVRYPNQTWIRRIYTARGQLQGTGGWGPTNDSSTTYQYLPDGKVNFQVSTNGVRTDYRYNDRGMIGSIRHWNGNESDPHNLAYRGYWRDKRDRIVAWKRGMDNSINGMEDGRGDRYGYDPEGQLTSASYRAVTPEATPSSAFRTDSFQYDKMGNRMGPNYVASRVAWMNMKRRDDNGLNQYIFWDNHDDHPVPDPLHWESGISYDDNLPAPSPTPSPGPWPWVSPGNGVMMQDGYMTGAFNALNQPVGIWSKIYEGTGNWMWFGYDPLGRCVKRWKSPFCDTNTTVATFYYFDGWNLVQEGPNAGTADRVYVHGGRMDEIVASQVGAGGPWYFHHYDASGNCILQSNAAGAVQVQYEYDAFGYPYPRGAMGGKGASQTRFLFTGREWLGDLRLYDYRNRLYQPEIGRFLQPDPKQFEAGDYNLYRYCHNDPINKADPDGLTVVVDISDPGFFVIESMALHEVAATESGGKAIAQLEDSQNLHIISPKQDFVTSKFNAGDERSAVTTATNVADSHNGCGSGSRIEINPSDQQNYNDTPASQLGHEIGHAQDIDSGNAAEPSRGSGLNYYAGPAEENALKIEMEVKKNQ